MSDFEAFFYQYPIPSWIYSAKTLRFLAVNDAAVKGYGYPREQFLQMTIEQIRPADDLDRLREHLAGSGNLAPQSSIWRHLRSDGTCIDVEIIAASVTFAGEPARLVSARNVSGQLNHLDRLNLALVAGKIAIWEYNMADGSLHWDPTNSGVYGIDRSYFPKNQPQFLNMVEPPFREGLQRAFEHCVNDGVPYDCEFRLHIPGVGIRWRHAIGKRLVDRAGTPTKIIGIGLDITDRKILEEQIHRSQKLEAVGRLASGIAHDFNNILTVISGYGHLIKGGLEPAPTVESAGEICLAAERAARLVRQLLEFSRTTPLDPKPVQVNQLIADTLVLIRRLLPTSIRVCVDVTPEILEVSADPGQIEQLIMNLCLNARDAMRDGGTLHISVSRCQENVLITVSDTGSGISPEVQEKMFEPFFTTKEVGSGSGLGLSIVHGIVKQLNGSIQVHSRLGQGSTFSVQLPAVRKS